MDMVLVPKAVCGWIAILMLSAGLAVTVAA